MNAVQNPSLLMSTDCKVFSLAGGLFLPETPNNLIERGRTEEARIVLEKTRGTSNVDAEFNSIVAANEAVKHLENPWRTLLRREYLPFLFLAAILPGLQQWSGINAVRLPCWPHRHSAITSW